MWLFGFVVSDGFTPDRLSMIMTGIILFVTLNVIGFSRRFLDGDRHANRALWQILLLSGCLVTVVNANHFFLTLLGTIASHVLLTRLIIHKPEWAAARNSGRLAGRAFAAGLVSLSAGFWLVSHAAGTANIHESCLMTVAPSFEMTVGLLLVAVAAIIQSAAWPFHRWLISSLNSPTPVSAMTIVCQATNGGFLILRLAPLFSQQPLVLHGLFWLGLASAVIGQYWALIQTDIKRSLTCAAISQMGFVLMECGLGLFAPAFAHLGCLCLFNAYRFLNVGSVLQERRSNRSVRRASLTEFLTGILGGIAGAGLFVVTSGTKWNSGRTDSLLICLAFVAAFQLARGAQQRTCSLKRLAVGLLLGLGTGGLFGLGIALTTSSLPSLRAIDAQPMHLSYVAGIVVLCLIWLSQSIQLPARFRKLSLWKRFYIAALNGSQPHPETVTANRTSYQF